MKKKLGQNFLVVILLILNLVLFSGCGQQEKAVTGETKTVTDCIGRKVEVPLKVERIACLYAFSGHVVTMLGKGDEIVAVVEGLKRDTLLNEICSAISDASVPASSGSINVEEVLKAAPDVIFIKGETAQSDGEIEKLNKTGIPYLVVDYRNMKEQQYAISMIGQAIGAEEKAEEYCSFYQECLDRVGSLVCQIPETQKVRIYHSVNEAVRTDSANTLPADWIETAGAINVSVHEKLKFMENKYFASLEQILLWDPDVILVNEQGVARYIMENKQWSPLQAVKNNKVYQMPNGISRWGHPGSLETPLAVLWTAKIIYPDLFTDLDINQETKQFYMKFFGIDLSDEMVAKVLSGEGMRVPKK